MAGKTETVNLPPEQNRVNVYPTIPADDLACDGEPVVPAMVTTDVQALQWAQSVRDAGASCRKKIQTLQGIVSAWPKAMM